MYNYVVTAHKPTCVTTSITGNFTSPNEINLIISKTTRLEIHTLTPDGLEPFLDVGIYGRISSLLLFRPKEEKTDLLFLLTEKNTFCVLGYDQEKKQIVTKSTGDLRDKYYRPIPVITSIDPENRVIGLLLYTGYLKVIPIDPITGALSTPFNIRIDETNIISLKFLSNCEIPTFTILYRDAKENKNIIKTYKFNYNKKPNSGDPLEEGPWRRTVDPFTHLIIPVPTPYNGVLIISDSSIQYSNHETGANINHKFDKMTTILSFGKVDSDGSRYLLGDNKGVLYGLVLERDENLVIELKLKKLGVGSISSSISYLDNGVVYIGSYCGDSQLIKLSEHPTQNSENLFEVLDSFINLGPITDFCLVDNEKQGQNQIVTCSGCFSDGSLRIIRNGVGVNQQAVLELPGVKGLWTIKSKHLDLDDYLIVSFIGITRVYSIIGEEIEDVTIPGIEFTSKTLHCSNLTNGNILQITEKSIRVIDRTNFDLLSEWKPVSEIDIIHLADVNDFQQILISVGKSDLVYLEVTDENQVQLRNKIDMGHEVSSLNLHSLSYNQKASICAIGLWTDNSVRLLSLPTFDERHKEIVSSELPRSLLLITLEGISYLLCGLGDGQLIIYTINDNYNGLTYKQKISIGTQPAHFTTINSSNRIGNNAAGNSNNNSNSADQQNATSIFVSSDKPSLFYSYNKRLICSSINLSEMSYVSTLNTSSFQNCLAIYTSDNIIIGTIDNIQKLHLTTIPLNAMPRRISYQPSTNTYAVIVLSKSDPMNNGEEIEHYSIRLFDGSSFELLHTFDLPDGEIGSQISNFTVGGACNNNNNNNLININPKNNNNDNNAPTLQWKKNTDIRDEYYIVGVACPSPSAVDIKDGKLLVLKVQDSKLIIQSETKVPGAVYSIAQYNEHILTGVNTLVRMFQFNQQKSLSRSSSSLSNSNADNEDAKESDGDIVISDASSQSSNNGGSGGGGGSNEDKQISLSEITTRRGFIIVAKIATRGNSFIVGDVMRSVSLLYFNQVENKLEEIARDYLPKWITAIEFIDDDNYIQADHHCNLFTLQRQLSYDCDESRTRLETVGKFHIGDQINVFRVGSIVRRSNDSDSIPTVIFGSMMGMIGVIASISKEDFDLFEKVQASINNVIKGVGGLTHEDWRAPLDDRKMILKSSGFIDGDLVESFLELNAENRLEVVKKLNISVDELRKKIENLSQLLH